MEVTFSFHQVPSNLPKRLKLKRFIAQLFKMEQIKAHSISFVFCTDDYLFELNSAFLEHDTYTDILTFLLSPPELPIVGEIYISVDRVEANADEFGIKGLYELHRIIFHGILHLCGYNDKSCNEKKAMTQLEDHYLRLYFC